MFKQSLHHSFEYTPQGPQRATLAKLEVYGKSHKKRPYKNSHGFQSCKPA